MTNEAILQTAYEVGFPPSEEERLLEFAARLLAAFVLASLPPPGP